MIDLKKYYEEREIAHIESKAEFFEAQSIAAYTESDRISCRKIADSCRLKIRANQNTKVIEYLRDKENKK